MRQCWFRFLASYLRLAVGEIDADPAPVEDAESPSDVADEPVAADEAESPDSDAAPQQTSAQSAFERRLSDLERENRELRSRPAPSPAPTAPRTDPEFDREEAQLAEAGKRGATENELGWLRWQIDSNRAMRRSQRDSAEALNEARNLSDKADFDRLQLTNPKVYAKFRDQIETQVASIRSNGQVIQPGMRRAALAYLLGNELLDGNLKPKAPAAKTAPTNTNADRRTLPPARGDVSARQHSSEREKRRQRLENLPI